MLQSRFLLSLAAIFALAACSDSKDGGGDERTNEGLWEPCVETRKGIGEDDATPFGMTAGEAFAFAKGSHGTTMRYSGGQVTGLTVLVDGDPSEIVLVERKPNPGDGERFSAELGYDCKDGLEAKMPVSFETEDGAFQEKWDAVLFRWERVGEHSILQTNHPIDLDALTGSYVPNELAPTEYDRLVQASVQIAIAESGGFEGRITYLAEKSHGDGKDGSVSARSVTVAGW